jgi:8-oxo-dGTP pyrophosphatase MutT (NUDIX family)
MMRPRHGQPLDRRGWRRKGARFGVDAMAAAATVARMNEASPVAPVPAATLLLVRDGARGLEVLMAARHEKSGFAAGALVFPGGKVDAGDVAVAGRCRGLGGLPDAAAAARVAAIRETWEETGVLLARSGAQGPLLTQAELSRLRERRGGSFEVLLQEPGLELAGDRLAAFAHWITPADSPKRFDTLFFLAAFDGDQAPLHDGHEAVDARWVNPAEAVGDADAGRCKIVFATRLNLLRLARSQTVAAALAAARGPVVTVVPEVVKTATGAVFRIPAEAGYGVTEVPVQGIGRA